MRYLALATDYDGTLAGHGGRVHDDAVAALERLRASGRRALLVTGRRLGELESVFPRLDLIDVVVAENGAVLHRPAARRTNMLCPPPPAGFARALRERGVEPLEIGQVIELFPQLQAMRARTGRPHWIVVDEVHHVLPASWALGPSVLPRRLGEMVLITVHPREVASPILTLVDIAVAIGPTPEATLADFASAVGAPAPRVPGASGRVGGEAVAWSRAAASAPQRMRVIPARAERLRHLRKYAEGNLGSRGFFFRGPDRRLNLRAQNLVAFCEIGAGVDAATWIYHLRRGHYSSWVRDVIKDADLAREIAEIEQAGSLSAEESRRLVRDAIDRRYTLPA